MTAVEPQVAAGTKEQLIRHLADVGGIRAPDGGAARGAVTVRIPAEALEEATNRLASMAGVRLADMFAGGSGGSPRADSAAADGDTTVLRLVWAYEAEQPGYIITESEIEGEQYPPLSDIAPPRSSKSARSTSSSASGPRAASRSTGSCCRRTPW